MAVTYEYSNNTYNFTHIFLATTGGTVFSANLAGSATIDYFDDASVVDDAIYFGYSNTRCFADITFDVGTQLVADAITVVWEFYNGSAWVSCEQVTDNTNAFQDAGSNTVVIPLQHAHDDVSVNSVTKFWVRVKITAVTNISEGGANQTTEPFTGSGLITFDGTASDDMANLPDLFTWMDSNHPEVEMTQDGYVNDHYRIPRSFIFIENGQYFEMDGEILAMSDGDIRHGYAGANQINQYNLIATDSTIIIDGQLTGNYYYWKTSTLVRCHLFSDDASFRITGSGDGNVWTDVSTSVLGGFSPNIEFRSLEGTGTFLRCSIMPFLVLGAIAIDHTDCIWYGARLILYYARDWTVSNHTFGYEDGRLFILSIVRSTDSNQSLSINPTTPFKDINDANGPLQRGTAVTTAPTKCWFYDDSAGTYTDYTTEAGDDSTGDVPFSGDVGDILYFGATHSMTSWSHPKGQGAEFVMDTVNTDYVYVYEWWNGSAWEEIVLSETMDDTITVDCNGYDATYNFTQSGKIFLTNQSTDGQTSVNGTTAYWHRLRIATKGTGTPTITRIYIKAETAANNLWRMKEKNTFDLRVVDDTNTAIQSATVIITDSDGVEQFNGSTDASGDIAQQTFLYKEFKFDPFNYDSLPTYQEIIQKTFGDYIVIITKAGYVTKTLLYTMDQKRVEVEQLTDINTIETNLYDTTLHDTTVY